MADVTIAQLPTLAVEPTDVVEIQKTGGGESGKYTVQELANLAPTGVAWGQITGNLANQTDLQAALDAKADADAYLPLTGGDLDGTLSAIDIIGVRSGTYPLFFTKSSFSGNAATGELRMSDLDGVQIAQIGVLSNSHNDLYLRANLGELVFQPEGNITAGRWSATGLDIVGTLDVGGAFTSTGIDDNATSTAVTIDSSQNVGITDSAPLNRLTVTTNNNGIRVKNSASATDRFYDLLLTTTFGGNAGYIGMDDGANVGFVNFGQEIALSAGPIGAVTEALRIDSGQNVLVGDTSNSAFARLRVAKNGFWVADFQNTNATENGAVAIRGGDSTSITQSLNFTYANGLGKVLAGGDDDELRLEAAGGASVVTVRTNNAEALRIDSDQNVLFSTTSIPSASNPGFGYDANLNRMRSSTGVTTGVQHYQFFNPNGTVGSITTSGSATAYNTSSDPRLKTNGKAVDGVEALALIRNAVETKALYKFQWVTEFEKEGDEAQWIWGFDAHKMYDMTGGLMGAPGDGPRDAELGSVYQEEITEEQPVLDDEGEPVLDDDGNPVMRTVIVQPEKRVTPWGVDQSKPVPILAAALDELARQLEELKATIH